MDPADRNDELVAHAASEGSWLCEGEVVRIRGHPTADKARLPQYESPVILIAQANRLSQKTNHLGVGILFGSPRSFLACTCVRPANRHRALVRDTMGRRPRCHIR